MIDYPDADHSVFEAEVGKGFYIRALARDLAQALGTEGHVSQLARLNVGKFSLDNAISLEKLEEAVHGAALDTHLLPIETALDDIPALALTETEASKLKQGQSPLLVFQGRLQTAGGAGAGVRRHCAGESRGPILLPSWKFPVLRSVACVS